MFEFLHGWIIYPFAEISHALQGVLAGYLASRAILKKEISDALCAILITIAFGTYEITEQWKINDSAYQDFENYWLSAMATGLIYFGIRFGSKFIGSKYGDRNE